MDHRDVMECAVWIAGWVFFFVKTLISVTWFPLLVVGMLCLIERYGRRLRHPIFTFSAMIFLSSVWSAVGFRTDQVRIFHDTNWMALVVGCVAGLALWFFHSSKMDLLRLHLGRPLRPRKAQIQLP